MVCPWSTKRPCGPLAFRRATEGSRVRGKMWGCQEGDKKPGGCLGPLLSPPPDGGIPPPPDGGNAHAMSWRTSPVPGGPVSPAAASRRNGGTVHPLMRVKFFRGCPTAVNTTVLPPVRQHPQDGIPLPAHISRGTTAHPQTRPPAPCRLARNYSAAPVPLHHNG